LSDEPSAVLRKKEMIDAGQLHITGRRDPFGEVAAVFWTGEWVAGLVQDQGWHGNRGEHTACGPRGARNWWARYQRQAASPGTHRFVVRLARQPFSIASSSPSASFGGMPHE